MKNMTPPKWAPNAIATNQGWVNPKTKEILVSFKGLKDKIDNQNPVSVLEFETSKECPTENAFVEITTEPVSENLSTIENTEEVLKKRGRGRPKENKTVNHVQNT